MVYIHPGFDMYDDIIDAGQDAINVQVHHTININPYYFDQESEINISIEINEIIYEYQILIHTTIHATKWNSDVYSCHGEHFYLCWCYLRNGPRTRVFT